jgi:hypothetical protein
MDCIVDHLLGNSVQRGLVASFHVLPLENVQFQQRYLPGSLGCLEDGVLLPHLASALVVLMGPDRIHPVRGGKHTIELRHAEEESSKQGTVKLAGEGRREKGGGRGASTYKATSARRAELRAMNVMATCPITMYS